MLSFLAKKVGLNVGKKFSSYLYTIQSLSPFFCNFASSKSDTWKNRAGNEYFLFQWSRNFFSFLIFGSLKPPVYGETWRCIFLSEDHFGFKRNLQLQLLFEHLLELFGYILSIVELNLLQVKYPDQFGVFFSLFPSFPFNFVYNVLCVPWFSLH